MNQTTVLEEAFFFDPTGPSCKTFSIDSFEHCCFSLVGFEAGLKRNIQFSGPAKTTVNLGYMMLGMACQSLDLI